MLYPKTSIDKPVEFTKSSGKWKVQQSNIVSDTRKNEVENILMEILSIKPQNLMTKSKTKWIDYEVSDSTGTRIKLLTGEDEVYGVD